MLGPCALVVAIGAARAETPDAPSAEAPPPAAEAVLERPGPALRAALDAAGRGEDARAVAILEAVARRHPIVADHADRLRVEILARGDDPAAAVAAAREAVERHATSPLAARLYAALGDALAAAGQEAEARAAWEVALQDTERATERSRLLAALGESHARAGEMEAAGRAFLEIWREHPRAAAADRAEAGLREVEAALGRSLRDALDYKARGDALRADGHNEFAILAYDAALELGGLTHRDRRRILHSRAHSLFSIRRYEEAIQAYTDLAPDPGSAVSRARSIARAGDVPRAIAELEAIAGGRWGRTSVYARYLAALLLEDEDQLDRARVQFARVAREERYPRYANPSLWYLGWTAWRRGDRTEARDQFDRLVERLADDPLDQLRARYWAARAREALDEDGAAEAFAAVAAEFPLTYYGWRARARATSVEPVPRPPLEPGRRVLRPADLARPRILIEAGLDEAATPELLSAIRRAGGVEDRVEVCRLLAEAGEHHLAQSLVVRRYRTELARGVVPGQEALWRLAWPQAWSDLIRELQPERPDVDAAVVSAVMREESGYRPGVTSPAGARGLLQIMPETGRRLARQLGLPAFDPEDLYRPRVNIQLGAFYLGELARTFDGRMEAAIASYNAGPEAAARWTREQPDLADDEWVEAVPYAQTRAYVKRVLRSVHAYREIY